ncbi:MAG: phosphate ABC transporter substrate-binding protein [Oscillospiraceae bacterium]|nr:phosphate ABC transporter substrate-binding protein [Oscillospiraceae bacterium]MDY4191159.1 phosphate ABC transporter substrate-binding protein [Oscillospiraceae bacterium]
MKLKQILCGVLSAAMMTTVFAGCGSTPSSESSAPESSAPSSSAASSAKLSGTISMSGSTSMEELVKAMAEDFMAKNPGVTIDPQFNGSGQGIKDAQEGKADIGNSSRELKDEETGLVPTTVAIDGIAVIINTANTAADLTMEQLAKIYTGEIKNWSEVGGADAPIVVIGRDAASGTRGAFEEIVGVKDACAYAQEKDSTGGVKTAVASTPDAIGYVSLEAANSDDTVKKLTIDAVEATEENIVAGSYKLSRPFIMAVKEGEVKPEVQAFLDYALSADGQAIVKTLGLITVA